MCYYINKVQIGFEETQSQGGFMKVAGIITEYNPFHNGHKYQLSEVRRITSADYIVIAMSGNFVQRGTPAIMDKYARTQMALNQGADLVLELPSMWATASAEYFAKGGVSLLNSTGVVNKLCFGAECTELSVLQEYCRLIIKEDDPFKEKLNLFLKKGLSYPMARMKAHGISISHDFSSPNNILAIEYLKALQGLDIEPVLIPRLGDGYNDSSVNSILASATAIRNLLHNNDADQVQELTPCYDAIKDYYDSHGFVCENYVSEMLYYKLLSEKEKGYTQYADCNASLSAKIVNMLPKYCSFEQFCNLLKSKDITHSRIRRVLCHILLGITSKDMTSSSADNKIPYIRILGFRKEASSLLNSIKKEAAAPIITKVADASSHLDSKSQLILDKDIFASNLYNALINRNNKNPVKNDFCHEIIIL